MPVPKKSRWATSPYIVSSPDHHIGHNRSCFLPRGVPGNFCAAARNFFGENRGKFFKKFPVFNGFFRISKKKIAFSYIDLVFFGFPYIFLDLSGWEFKKYVRPQRVVLVNNIYGGDPWIPCASPGAPCVFWVLSAKKWLGGGVDQLFAPKPHFCPGLPLWYKKSKKIWRNDWCVYEHFTHIMSGQAIITSAGTKN